ncbi:MAG: hypothetical protein IT437_12690 [Phycisphaerales bacterium]|nr:hypothetical protein [Phycisphaerales bacterium]
MDRLWTVGAALCLAAGASAQVVYSMDFEAPVYAGSAAGTPLTTGFGGGGQDGWYNPVSGSNDTKVYTVVGNTYNVSANPQGGDQFQVGDLTPAGGFGRAQHAIAFTGGKWKATWDCTGLYAGTLPAPDNLGSFSLQPSTTSRYFQQLMAWGSTAIGPAPNAANYTATADKFHIAYGYFINAAATAPTFATPGPEWRDLPVNHWYRCTVSWDFDTAQVTECTIQDLTTGGPLATVDVTPLNWYLFGGPASTKPLPTDVRIFAGGGSGTGPAGNVTAFDNISFEKVAVCYPDCNGDGALNLSDFGCFTTKFALGQAYADCNGDGVLNLSDFGCFTTKFALGCP